MVRALGFAVVISSNEKSLKFNRFVKVTGKIMLIGEVLFGFCSELFSNFYLYLYYLYREILELGPVGGHVKCVISEDFWVLRNPTFL